VVWEKRRILAPFAVSVATEFSPVWTRSPLNNAIELGTFLPFTLTSPWDASMALGFAMGAGAGDCATNVVAGRSTVMNNATILVMARRGIILPLYSSAMVGSGML
jgi:hypothetical protein